MKLIKRTTLQYQQGTSDKVYEVDLCEISAGDYVVNFRYGKRGGNLKDGTKTTQTVSLEKAQQVFDKLVGEKTKKGYQDTSIASVTPVVEGKEVRDRDAHKQAILSHLENIVPSNWKLERVIWRAGELKIKEATPYLVKLIGTGEALRDYCIAWSLGWCGGEGAIPALIGIYQNASTPEFVSRIAFEALLKLSDEGTKAELQEEMIEFLPHKLQKLAKSGCASSFGEELNAYLETSDYQGFKVLDTIYQIDNQYMRPALLEILRTAPFKANYFQRIRHIFKIAEYRHDSEVFSIIAYRLEKEKAMFSSKAYEVSTGTGEWLRSYIYEYDSTTRRYYNTGKNEIRDELKLPSSRIAYSSKTREYLQRRVWRTLKQLGEEGDKDYINMAVEFLLQYADSDGEGIKDSVSYRWKQEKSNWKRIEVKRSWDAYAGYITFNHILYENSPRYELKTNSQAWRLKEGYKVGDGEPNVREEAFPQLWEEQPQALLRLLLESQCQPIHHFAVKVLKVCQQFCNSLDIDTIIRLVNTSYEVTADFGFALAQTKYNSREPNTTLVLALVNCLSERARKQAYEWIESQREYFFADSNFIASLVTSLHSDTRNFAKKLLGSSILNDTTAKVLIGRIIAELLTFNFETQGVSELSQEIGEILLFSFPSQLRKLGLNVIQDLLSHPLLEIQKIGAGILLNHEIPPGKLPSQIIESLLASSDESLRIIGIRLFGQLPDEKLIDKERELIVAIAINPNSEIRNAIKPIIHRLGNTYPNFTIKIASEFLEILLTPEQHEGIHSFLVHLLREDLPGWMTTVSKETTLNLLKAKSSPAQEVGGLLLGENYQNWITEFTTREIVKLANHEIVSVREAAQKMFMQTLERLRTDSQEMIYGVRMLEAKWEDSRKFALEIFTQNFTEKEFTPEVLVAICDSVREEARRLGRDLLTRNFQSVHGEEYLLKFSEHPSTDMQLFATNYLEKYAVDNPERLQQLAPFFVSVLCRVNRGSVAKQRIFAFLETEAQKNQKSAEIIGEIMARQSVTMVIGDKAKTIQIMLKINHKYPDLKLPIEVKSVVQMRK